MPASLAMFLWAWGCNSPTSAEPDVGPGNVVMAPADGGTIELPAGCVLQVDLASNPTTGYRWQVDRLPRGLAVEGESVYVPASDQPVMGGGGTEQWRFAAEKVAVDGELVMSYRRPWERDASPARTYTVTVRVLEKR